MKLHLEFSELLQNISDGTATTEDSARLNALMREHPELQEEYLQWMATQAALSWEYREAYQLAASEENLLHPVDVTAADRPRNSFIVHLVRWTSGAAAILLVALFVFRPENSAMASPTQLLRDSLQTLAGTIEREYIVDIKWEDPEIAKNIPPKDIHVTTWQDRFWLEILGKRRVVIGSENDGSMWISLSMFRGIELDKDEIGPVLQDIKNLYGLKLQSMLEGILRDHEIEMVAQDEFTSTISATPRLESSWIRQVTIEIDRESKAIRKLTARRESALRGFSTVSFTLAATQNVDEAKYELMGHLLADAIVLGPDKQPDRRREVLLNILGPVTRGWMYRVQEAIK